MPNIRIETDVVATTVGDRDLKVDIFYPGENANGLGIVFLPGGDSAPPTRPAYMSAMLHGWPRRATCSSPRSIG